MPKQLSLSERIMIEIMIHQDYTFASIARRLERSTGTISRFNATNPSLESKKKALEKISLLQD